MAVSRVSATRKEIGAIPAVVDVLVSILGGVISPIGKPSFEVTKVPHVGWVARTRQLEGRPVTDYPYIGLALQSFSDRPDYRYNQQALYNGLPVSDDNGSEWRYKLGQVLMRFSILIRDDSEERIQGIISRFKFRERDIQAKVNIGGLTLPLKVQFDQGFSVPEMEPDMDGNNFTLQTSVAAYFFMGEAEQLPAARSLDIDVLARKQGDSVERLDSFAYHRNSRGKFGIVDTQSE